MPKYRNVDPVGDLETPWGVIGAGETFDVPDDDPRVPILDTLAGYARVGGVVKAPTPDPDEVTTQVWVDGNADPIPAAEVIADVVPDPTPVEPASDDNPTPPAVADPDQTPEG